MKLFKPVQKILIVNFGGIGDLLLSTPALRSLRELYPRAEISMLLTPSGCNLAKRYSYIDNVFTFHMKYDGTVPLTLRRKHFDLAINMRTLGSKKSAQKIKYLLHLINPLKTIGRDTEGLGHFFNVKIPESALGERCEMEYDIDTVQALGARVNNRSIDVEIDNSNIERVNDILRKHNIDREDVVVGVHPGGKPSHRWDIRNFSQIIDKISSEISCKFVITGGSDEVNLSERLRESTSSHIVNMAGRLDIEELFALVKRCNLFITNDTGPMHIAAAFNTPLVAVFGPGYLKRYDPRTIHEKAEVFYKQRVCAPCDNVECASMECLQDISPEEVTGSILRLLNPEKAEALAGKAQP
jgi:heptosyltransferase-2